MTYNLNGGNRFELFDTGGSHACISNKSKEQWNIWRGHTVVTGDRSSVTTYYFIAVTDKQSFGDDRRIIIYSYHSLVSIVCLTSNADMRIIVHHIIPSGVQSSYIHIIASGGPDLTRENKGRPRYKWLDMPFIWPINDDDDDRGPIEFSSPVFTAQLRSKIVFFENLTALRNASRAPRQLVQNDRAIVPDRVHWCSCGQLSMSPTKSSCHSFHTTCEK
jgi:hypothetical protein